MMLYCSRIEGLRREDKSLRQGYLKVESREVMYLVK
jgi:hypothetical protein